MASSYLGPQKILEIQPTEHDHLVRVVFEKAKDVTQEHFAIWSKELLDAVKTEKETDWTELRNRRMQYVGERILGIILHYNVRDSEVVFLLDLIRRSLEENILRAQRRLWRRDGEVSLPDLDERTFQQVDDVIRSYAKGAAESTPPDR